MAIENRLASALQACVFALASTLCTHTSSLAAVEVNQATEAELDSVKGLGPSSTARILKARAQGAFKDWGDLMARVKGFKPPSAAKLSKEGLTVNGSSYPALSHPPSEQP
jgi:competence protein ComEA